MAKFSESDFQLALKTLCTLPDVSTVSRYTALAQSEPQRVEAATAFFLHAKTHYQGVLMSPAVARILGDRAIHAGWASASRNVKYLPPQESLGRFVSYMVSEPIESVQTYAPEYAERRVVWYLDRFKPLRVKWAIHIVSALQEYFSEARPVQHWKSLHQRLADLHEAVRIGADALHELTALAVSVNPSGYRGPKAHGDVEAALLRTAIRRVEEINAALPPAAFRQDSTAQERLLVYRLVVAHKHLFRQSRASAIVELLQADGVRPLDRRNIERACSSFADVSRTHGLAQYGRILHQNRPNTAGANL